MSKLEKSTRHACQKILVFRQTRRTDPSRLQKQPPSSDGKQISSPALPATSVPTIPGPATSSPQGYGSHLRLNEPNSTPAELADHDYAATPKPGPLTDHNYFMTVPLPESAPPTSTPPGFNTGRTVRNRTLPARYHDYELN